MRTFLRPILVAGFACGALDITAAIVVYGLLGLPPIRLLQGIAGGLLGPRTYHGGIGTAALGLACHFIIALLAAATYFVLSRRIRFLVDRPMASGVLYGIAVYYFMNLVVVRLSAARKYPFSITMMAIGIAIHIVCVGLPIALIARCASPQTPAAPPLVRSSRRCGVRGQDLSRNL